MIGTLLRSLSQRGESLELEMKAILVLTAGLLLNVCNANPVTDTDIGDMAKFLLHKEQDPDQGHSHARLKRDIGAGVFESPWTNVDWNKLGKDRIYANMKKVMNVKRAKNVILLMGDGMGFPTVAAARAYRAQQENLKQEDTYLSWERFPYAGLSRTYSVDKITPDSAVTGTAYLTGTKANLGTIGVNEKVKPGVCANIKGNEVRSILHKTIQAGRSTGIVTTARLTHASPAATYASTALRLWESEVSAGQMCVDIGTQLVKAEQNQKIKVLLGGGWQMLKPNTTAGGLRTDGVDLIQDWTDRKTRMGVTKKVLNTRQDLMDLDVANTEYVLGTFHPSNMNFELDRNSTLEPSLAEMTGKAIDLLKKDPKGFFLFVEGARIDMAHHATLGKQAIGDTIAFHDAVSMAVSKTDPADTLIIVTADHSHTFTLGGYGSFSENVLGFGDDFISPPLDGKPYLQLTYANGPGAEVHRFKKNGSSFVEVPRLNLTTLGDQIYDKTFMQDAPVWNNYETHGGEDVGIYAQGPWAHLFQSTEEQTYIAHTMMYASCVGDYANEAHCPSSALSSAALHSVPVLVLVLSMLLAVMARL